MGTSTASNSEATINTSTDSASTLVTNVTSNTDTDATNDSLDLGSAGQSEPLLSSLDEPTSISSLVSPRLLKSRASDQESLIESPCTVVYYQKRALTHHQQTSSSISEDDDLIEISGLEDSYHRTTPKAQNNQSNRCLSSGPEKGQSKFTFDEPPAETPSRRSSKINCSGKFGDSSSSSSSSPSSVSANTVTIVSPLKGDDDKLRKDQSHPRFYSPNPATGNGGSGLNRVVFRDKFTKKRINSAPLVSTTHSMNSMKTDSTMFPFDREAIDYERIQRECFAVDEQQEPSRHYPFLDLDTDPDSPVYDKPASIFQSPSKTAYGRSQCNVAHESNEMTERYCYPPAPSNNCSSNGAEDLFRQYAFLSQQERNKSRDRRSPNMKRAKGTNSRQADAFSPKPAKSRHSPGYVNDHPEKDESGSQSTSPASLSKFDQINTKFEQIPPNQRRTSNCFTNNGHCKSANALSPTIGGHHHHAHSRAGDPNLSPTMVRITPPLPDLKVDFYNSQQRSDDDDDDDGPDLEEDGGQQQRGRSSQNRNNSPDRYNCGSHHSQYQHSMMGSYEAGGGGGDDQKRQPHRGDANLDGCQKNALGSINVTPNPLDGPVCTQPRATIVVQQVRISQF